MSKIVFLIIIVLSYFTFLKSECDLSLFSEKNIIPSVIPEVPKQTLTVKLSGKTVSCGDLLAILSATTLTGPEISYNADENTYYTLIMIDPDAPSPGEPLISPFLHWFVINIPADDISSGEVQTLYMDPTPPPTSPEHRYIIIVLKQDGYQKDYQYLGTREKFNLTKEMEELGLSEITYGMYYNVTSEPGVVMDDALKSTAI